MPGFLDRHRAARLMAEQGLDALVLAQPETITYATGAFPGVATYWRRAGAAFVVVPADADRAARRDRRRPPGEGLCARSPASPMCGPTASGSIPAHYPDIDPDLPRRSPRPAQYDLSASLGLLRDMLAERGIERPRRSRARLHPRGGLSRLHGAARHVGGLHAPRRAAARGEVADRDRASAQGGGVRPRGAPSSRRLDRSRAWTPRR